MLGVAAWQDEVGFQKRDFPDVASVDRAASQIRTTYVMGYGLAGIGGGLLATNAIGLPASASVRLRW